MQANSFRNVAGSATIGGAGAITCSSLTSTGAVGCTALTSSTQITAVDILCTTAKTAGSGTPCVFNASNFLAKSTSALKFKRGVSDCTLGLEFVLSNRSVQYLSAIEGEEDAPLNYGFIADEFEESNPELVIYEDEEVFSFNYRAFHGIHHKAIQDLNAKLEEENTQLRSIIDDLIARVEALES
jgi:hypothetical protein